MPHLLRESETVVARKSKFLNGFPDQVACHQSDVFVEAQVAEGFSACHRHS
jgi:hypothetical protein